MSHKPVFTTLNLWETNKEYNNRIAKACNCSDPAVYTWIQGGRPLRKYLPGISSAMGLRLSRLETIWLRGAVAMKAKDAKKPVPKTPKEVHTFVPVLDDLQVAVSLVKLGAERRDNVMNLVKVLELGRKL